MAAARFRPTATVSGMLDMRDGSAVAIVNVILPDIRAIAMNRLADETSPYLQQHAANPVDWYPWEARRL